MHKRSTWAVLGAAALSSFFALPVPAGSAHEISNLKAAGAGTYYMSAEIIPAEDTAVGTSTLSGGSAGAKAGESVWANGVNNVWLTGKYTINFVVFVFSSHAETGNVEFKVLSPKRAAVYDYTFKSQKLPRGEYWYTVAANANYAEAGLYLAELSFEGHVEGTVPLNFEASGSSTPST